MPGTRFVIGWIDEDTPHGLPEHIEIIPCHIFADHHWAQMCARYTDIELAAACRPLLGLTLAERSGEGEQVTFLSPTTSLYRSFDHLDGTRAPMFLSPNIAVPTRPGPGPDDKRILNIGMFHSGAWGLRASEETRRFLTWWSGRTRDRAFLDLCHGMCLDQLWLNYAPVLLDAPLIVRHPAWHIGLHNLSAIRLEYGEDACLADGLPLVSADFCGMTGFHPVWTDHAAAGLAHPAFARLFRRYTADLEAYESYRIPGLPAFGRPLTAPPFRNLRRSLKSNLERLNEFIDTFTI